MECSEDRGIECQGLCFNYVDGNVTLTVFKNLPGVARERAGTIFQRAFSPQEWEEINRFLMKTLDKVEGVFVDDFDEDEDEDEEEAKEAESSPLFEQVVPEAVGPLDRRNPTKANSIPKMTKEEDGKEV